MTSLSPAGLEPRLVPDIPPTKISTIKRPCVKFCRVGGGDRYRRRRVYASGWGVYISHPSQRLNIGSAPLPPGGSRRGIQPITAVDPAQLMQSSNHSSPLSLSLKQRFSELITESQQNLQYRLRHHQATDTCTTKQQTPAPQSSRHMHHQAPDSNITKQQTPAPASSRHLHHQAPDTYTS